MMFHQLRHVLVNIAVPHYFRPDNLAGYICHSGTHCGLNNLAAATIPQMLLNQMSVHHSSLSH